MLSVCDDCKGCNILRQTIMRCFMFMCMLLFVQSDHTTNGLIPMAGEVTSKVGCFVVTTCTCYFTELFVSQIYNSDSVWYIQCVCMC